MTVSASSAGTLHSNDLIPRVPMPFVQPELVMSLLTK